MNVRVVLSILLVWMSCGAAAAQVKDVDLIDDRLGPENFRIQGGQDAICKSVPESIPDSHPGGLIQTMTIPCPASTIQDLDLLVQISHTWVGDLTVTLTKSGGGSAAVIVRPGEPAKGFFGCSADDIDAIINDEATDPIEDECEESVPTIQGEFIGGDPPDDSLMATWDGEDICGEWTIHVVDDYGGDIGDLLQWCLIPGVDAGDGGEGDVPSTNGVGVIVAVLLLLGSSAYYLRRELLECGINKIRL